MRRHGVGHVRQRAEDRAGAHDDVVHRRHAAPRAAARRAETLDLRVAPGGRASRPPAARLAVGARRSSPTGSGSPTARAWRSRPCTSARRTCPGSRPSDLEEQSFYELLRDRYGIVVVGGEQTIEPTVTDEDESRALGVPLHSPAFRFERVTHSRDRRDRRVRRVDLPRRPVPARHVAVDSAGAAASRAADGATGRQSRSSRRVVSTNADSTHGSSAKPR